MQLLGLQHGWPWRFLPLITCFQENIVGRCHTWETEAPLWAPFGLQSPAGLLGFSSHKMNISRTWQGPLRSSPFADHLLPAEGETSCLVWTEFRGVPCSLTACQRWKVDSGVRGQGSLASDCSGSETKGTWPVEPRATKLWVYPHSIQAPASWYPSPASCSWACVCLSLSLITRFKQG